MMNARQAANTIQIDLAERGDYRDKWDRDYQKEITQKHIALIQQAIDDEAVAALKRAIKSQCVK